MRWQEVTATGNNSVGQVDLDLNLNQRGFDRQLSNIQNIAGNVGKVLGKAFAIGSVVAFAKKCLDLGSDLNEVQNVVDVTFGSMSDKVNQWAKDAMTSFGLSEKCAKDYVGTLGTMAKSFGFSTEEAYKQATALAGLSADVASFYNLSTDDAYNKIKAVYTGETEGLKSLGVVMTQTSLDEFALAQGFGKTTAKMTEAEKVELRLAYVTQTLSGAAGDFARTSDGWANQTKVLSLRFDALRASLGQGLINVLTPALQLLNRLMEKLQTAAEMFRDFTAAVFGDAGGSSEAAADSAGALAENTQAAASAAASYKKSVIGIDTLNKLSDNTGKSKGSSGSSDTDFAAAATKSAENAFDGIADRFRRMISGIKNYFTRNFSGVFDSFVNGAKKNLDKTTGIFSRMWDTVKKDVPNFADWFNGGFTDLLRTSAEFGGNMFNSIWDSANLVFGDISDNIFPGFLNTLTTAILPSITNIGTRLVKTSGVIFDKVKGLFDSIWTDAVSPVVTEITGCWSDMWQTFSDWIAGEGQSLFDGVDTMFSGIGDTLQYFWDEVLAPFFEWAASTITPFYEEHIKPMLDRVLDWLSKAGEALTAWWNEFLLPFFKWIIDIISPQIKSVLSTIWTAVQNVFAMISDVLGGLFKSLGGLMDFITGVFTGNWEKAWTGIKDFFVGIWEIIWGAIKGVLNQMISAINSLWSGIVSVIQGIVNGIGGLVKAIGSVFGQDWGWKVDWADVPAIPMLASGGYVAANTPQLAVVGDNRREGEIIAPESKIAEAVATGVSTALSQINPSGGSQTVIVELDGAEVGRAQVEYDRRQLARSNGY